MIRDLKIAAPSDGETVSDLVRTLSADPSFVQAKTWRIDDGSVIRKARFGWKS